MNHTQDAIAIAIGFVRAVEAGDAQQAADYLHSDVVHEERPNRLFPAGVKRDLAAMVAGMERSKVVLARQSYDIRNVVASNDVVVLEMLWSGTLAIDVGSLPAGRELRAFVASVTEVRDGKIVGLRNYDCYEPW